MANLRADLERAERESGEQIEAIVVGRQVEAEPDEPLTAAEGVVLSRDVGLTYIDQDYYGGYGGSGARPLYAWTRSRVYFVQEHDGSTMLQWAPRHPVPVLPVFASEDETGPRL